MNVVPLSRVARVLVFAAALCCIAGCAAPGPSVALPAPYEAGGIEIAVAGVVVQGGKFGHVRGVAKNTGNSDLSFCVLRFDALDGQGSKIADASATSSGLKAGQVWQFDALFLITEGFEVRAIQAGQVLSMAK